MTESVMISFEAPALHEIDAMAQRMGMTRSTFVQSVVDHVVVDRAEQVALIEAGLRELDRADVVTQADMEELSARYRVVS